MKEIQIKELRRAVNLIAALGCSFKIITPKGEEYGSLEVKATKRRRSLQHEYGEMVSFYRPQLRLDAPIGEVQEIGIGNYAPEHLRKGLCSFLSKEWGAGTYTTFINRSNNCIEVLRTA